MDISKIRKKAKQRENGAEEPLAAKTPSPETPEEAVRATAPAAEPETPSEAAVEPPAEEVSQAGAAPAEAPDEAGGPEGQIEMVELLTFRLGAEEFAFRVSEIEEIIRHQGVTYVPTTPTYVRGITSLRGKVIPVIDLKVRLNLSTTSYVPPSHTLMAKEDQPDTTVPERSEKTDSALVDQKILIVSGMRGLIGAMIDQVVGVVRVPANEVLDPPAHLSEEEMKYIAGVVILDRRFISMIRADMTMDIEFR